MEDAGGTGVSNESMAAQAVGFITEFNQNAQIFNEQIAHPLDSLSAYSPHFPHRLETWLM